VIRILPKFTKTDPVNRGNLFSTYPFQYTLEETIESSESGNKKGQGDKIRTNIFRHCFDIKDVYEKAVRRYTK